MIPEKITVIPLAADEKKFYPCQELSKITAVRAKYQIPEKPYFLSLCTIEPRKNLIFALKAFDAYLAKYPESELTFVLAGGHWSRFAGKWESALAEMKHIKKRIILTGYIDDEDLAALYSGAEFFIYPSLYEGFGLPPLEAMQCGCPVITSNTSSLPEVVGNAGIMIAPDDLEGAVNAIESLLHNQALRKKYINGGLERAARFKWEKAAEIITDVIERNCNAK
ncbi:MAG: glycosyltransferase family 4 protein [Lentisphaeria bacterium]|nr:glycosyltransferase family 4 protein [Lentisphaeria bacterium]